MKSSEGEVGKKFSSCRDVKEAVSTIFRRWANFLRLVSLVLQIGVKCFLPLAHIQMSRISTGREDLEESSIRIFRGQQYLRKPHDWKSHRRAFL